jgi:O-methyltransferase
MAKVANGQWTPAARIPAMTHRTPRRWKVGEGSIVAVRQQVKRLAERALRVVPQPAMTPENVYAYLDALYHKRGVPGAVVEIGVATGGTTVMACRFLDKTGSQKSYVCVDTFSGFPAEQLETDYSLGLARVHRHYFRANSPAAFTRTLRRSGIHKRVEVVVGDISTLSEDTLPDEISVALVDVDLRDAIYAALERIYPRMARGGIILIDDCKKDTSWVGANVGYRDFVDKAGLAPGYHLGMGVVEVEGANRIPWTLVPEPI